MKDIQRYTPGWDHYSMTDGEDGDYVLIEDHAAIVAALQEQVQKLAAELSSFEAIHAECVFISDEDFVYCPANVQKIIKSLAVIQVPGYEAVIREIGAKAVEGFANGGCSYEVPHRIKSLLLSYAAKLRAGEKP